MNIKWFVFAVAISSVLSFSAEDSKKLDTEFWKLIDRLNEDDYQVREDTMHELSQFPQEYVRKLLQVAAHDKRPEVKSRAYKAAFLCFCLTFLPEDERWKTTWGTLGIDGRFQWDRRPLGQPDVFLGMEISFVYPKDIADGKLKEGDLIVEINGSPPKGLKGQIIAGKEYKIVALRSKEGAEPEKILVTLKAGWLRISEDSTTDELIDGLWKEFREGRPQTPIDTSRAEVVPEEQWDVPMPPLMPFPPIIGPQFPPK